METGNRKFRSQAQRDAQLNAMEAARGAAARRADAKREQARRDKELSLQRAREEARVLELRGGFDLGDRVTGRSYFFQDKHAGTVVDNHELPQYYPLSDGVAVRCDDGETRLMSRNSLEAE